MSKKRFLASSICIGIAILLNVCALKFVHVLDEEQSNYKIWNMVFCVILCVLIDLVMLVGVINITRLAAIPVEVYSERALIGNLAKNDFKTKFAGSYFGIVWAFVQPVITVLVYWFVFEVGLRAGRTCDYPFILWLLSGLVPWFYFSEALNGGTNALIEYNYLVKKVVFKISILPIVKTISAIFIHLIFIVFTVGLCWVYGYSPDLYSLQLIYYVLCGFALVLGLSYLTSALVVFFRDLTQIINIVLQVGIWITPIMWNAEDMLSSKVLIMVFKLNPVYYIVDGFRNALLDKIWFWEKPAWTMIFWLTVCMLFGLGVSVFRKLRIHFADVL